MNCISCKTELPPRTGYDEKRRKQPVPLAGEHFEPSTRRTQGRFGASGSADKPGTRRRAPITQRDADGKMMMCWRA